MHHIPICTLCKLPLESTILPFNPAPSRQLHSLLQSTPSYTFLKSINAANTPFLLVISAIIHIRISSLNLGLPMCNSNWTFSVPLVSFYFSRNLYICMQLALKPSILSQDSWWHSQSQLFTSPHRLHDYLVSMPSFLQKGLRPNGQN